MILNDLEIERLALDKKMIKPFNPLQLNPASYDIALGDDILLNPGEDISPKDISLKEKGSIILKPFKLILACSVEQFNLPNNIAAQFNVKSSFARRGLTHMMAGWCDPGWHGSVLTLELINMSSVPITLFYRQKIGQIIFMKLLKPTSQGYNGKYNDDKTVRIGYVDLHATV